MLHRRLLCMCLPATIISPHLRLRRFISVSVSCTLPCLCTFVLPHLCLSVYLSICMSNSSVLYRSTQASSPLQLSLRYGHDMHIEYTWSDNTLGDMPCMYTFSVSHLHDYVNLKYTQKQTPTLCSGTLPATPHPR